MLYIRATATVLGEYHFVVPRTQFVLMADRDGEGVDGCYWVLYFVRELVSYGVTEYE